MHKVFVFFKREYVQVVKKKSFVIGVVVAPVLMAAIMILPALLATEDVDHAESIAVLDGSGLHLGQEFSEGMNDYRLDDTTQPAYTIAGILTVDVSDEAEFEHLSDSLTELITAKELMYMISIGPEPHLRDSAMVLTTNSDNFRAIRRIEYQLGQLVSAHRLLAGNVNLPVDSVLALTRKADIVHRDTQGEAIPFEIKFFTGLIFVMMSYMMINIYGTTLMRSVIEEKNSRIMEVLVSSASPFQLMLGKVLGLAAAVFTQLGIWLAAGLVIYFASGAAMIEVNDAISRMIFNPVIVGAFVSLFAVGYIMYSAIFALIGSLVNSDKEAQQFIFPVAICLMVPIILGTSIARDPYATWVLVLSYIPFFSPTMMVMRTVFIAPTVTEYSLFSGIGGEVALAFLIVSAAMIGMVWLASRIFRVGILMYGKRPTFSEIIRWIRH